jgi:predicted transposase
MKSDSKTEILKLTSVTLSREKQDKIDLEFERYTKAVNYVIRAILKDHISSGKKTFDLLEADISNRFDRRPQFVRDVVKTAWGEVQNIEDWLRQSGACGIKHLSLERGG